MINTCKDCRYFLPVDVFKGICKKDKSRITPETDICANFDRVPKCKFCSHFTSDDEFLGKCMEKTPVYADLLAANCEDFSWTGTN